MSLKIKYCFRTLLSLIIIISLQSALLAGPREVVKWSDLGDHLAEKSVVIESMPVIDCPIGIDCDSAEHLVCQVIENVFYKWKEYEFFTAAGETRLAIVMIKPEARLLSADEALVLLNGSKLWEHQESAPLTNMTMRPAPVNHPKPCSPVVGHPRTYSGGIPLELAVDNSDDANSDFVPRSSILVDVDNESVTRESIHGTDDRDRVTSFKAKTTEIYPWNTICYLDVFKSGGSYRGSGILIAPYCVLTCGHNVWDWDIDRYSNNITVSPAQYQSYQGAAITEPYGTIAAAELGTSTAYTSTGGDRYEYDYGVVNLQQSFAGITTFMPLEYDATPTAVNIAGYPRDVQAETNSYDMWHDFGSVTGYEGTNNRVMLYEIDTSGGQSGAPVWRYNSDVQSRRLVAIHVYGSGEGNGGCRLVSGAMEDLIESWMEYEPVAPSYTYFSYVPYFTTSSGHWTGLALANYNNLSNSVKVDYYAANGSSLGHEYKDIDAYGQRAFITATSASSEGWIKVSSTSPLKGLVLIGTSAPEAMYDIDLKDSLHKKFIFPQVAADSYWNSYIMVCNPNNSTSIISFEYYNSGGTPMAPISKSIPKNGSAKYSVSTVFHQNLAGGTMVLKSSIPVTAFLLYDGKSTNFKAGLSAIPVN